MKTVTPEVARIRIRDMVALANSGGIYDGNRSVIYMASLAAILDAPASTEPTVAEVRAQALEDFAATVEPPMDVPTQCRRERYVRQDVKDELLARARAERGEA